MKMNTSLMSRLFVEERAHDSPVAIFEGRTTRFSEFKADVAYNSEGLRTLNCKRCALVCRDSYWFAVGLFAILQANAIAVVPPNGQPGTLEALADEYDLLLTDDDIAHTNAMKLDSNPEGSRYRFDLLAGLDPAAATIDFFTSGSTGAPKRVSKPIRLLEREIDTLNTLWGSEFGTGPVLATVSHQHIYGLTFKLLWPLCAAHPFARTTTELWEELLENVPPRSILVTSPAHLSRLDGLEPLPPSHRLDTVFSAGAPLLPESALMAETILGVSPIEIFGSTETGAIATRRFSGQPAQWQPLPGIRISQEEDGRLSIRSPFLVTEDWHRTDDLIEMQPNGKFALKGRADRVVKIEGKRVSLPEVEGQLANLSWITAAAVVMLDDDPVSLGAAVTLSPEGAAKLNELGPFRFSRFLRKDLSTFQESAGLPRRWRFVQHLSSGQMGKNKDSDIVALFNNEV